ncbi:hypothetical protein Vretifemale_5984 [Volvox reticuliferus]|uniref:Protein kinase domain-containing protein n=1 Tax=Volvox reticuliferus TaxID=1737510 RepID=A0A8J4CCE1_9CHLO|nr:hypothetical protein Vretifemale_5984 [Volvox reticuliferus]
MGQCVSKPPDGMDFTGAAQAGGQQGANPTGSNAAAAAATYQDPSAHSQHLNLAKRSFRSSNRSVIESLASIYQVKTVLGSGCEGKTWLTQDLSTGALWAVKMVKLPLHTKMVQAIFREIRIQSELGEGHINIITPQEVVLTSHYLGLVMEYAPGGSLTQYVTRKWKETGGVGLLMTEDEAGFFFKQIVHAVDYCHRHRVVHRDLKLDNTLLSAHNPPFVKICDFGFARGWGGENAHFNTIIGTPDYMPPQLTSAKVHRTETQYDGTKADVWSMGVLLAVMLLGKFPFDDAVNAGADPMRTVYLQQHMHPRWRDNPALRDHVPLLSQDALDLLDKCFEKDEDKRISVREIMQHPWFIRALAPFYQQPLDALFREQAELERRMMSGANKSKERDAAIANLIRMACSDEFKKLATAPLTPEFTFQLYSRINLRSVQDHYPTFNRNSVKAILKAESRRNSQRGNSGRPKLANVQWDPNNSTPSSAGGYGPGSGYGPQSGYGPASGFGPASGYGPQSGYGPAGPGPNSGYGTVGVAGMYPSSNYGAPQSYGLNGGPMPPGALPQSIGNGQQATLASSSYLTPIGQNGIQYSGAGGSGPPPGAPQSGAVQFRSPGTIAAAAAAAAAAGPGGQQSQQQPPQLQPQPMFMMAGVSGFAPNPAFAGYVVNSDQLMNGGVQGMGMGAPRFSPPQPGTGTGGPVMGQGQGPAMMTPVGAQGMAPGMMAAPGMMGTGIMGPSGMMPGGGMMAGPGMMPGAGMMAGPGMMPGAGMMVSPGMMPGAGMMAGPGMMPGPGMMGPGAAAGPGPMAGPGTGGGGGMGSPAPMMAAGPAAAAAAGPAGLSGAPQQPVRFKPPSSAVGPNGQQQQQQYDSQQQQQQQQQQQH